MLRPLLVYVGQGLSLADGLNLTAELRQRVPECFADAPNPGDLDAVLALWRDRMEGEPEAAWQERQQVHAKLHQALFQVTRPEAHATRQLGTTAALCDGLASFGQTRPVVLFTSNVDCAARDMAVGRGAQWLLGRDLTGRTDLDTVCRWIAEIEKRGPGFYFYPLHGEPDFWSAGDGGRYFATPEFKDWDVAAPGWFSTTAEGLGPHARGVDSTWSISQLGYGLLGRLLSGAGCDSQAGVDFLTVGYGAGASALRESYPYERTVGPIAPRPADRRMAIGRWSQGNESDRFSQEWFRTRGFRLEAVGDNPRTCTHVIALALRDLAESPN